ncbi:hypothetical protein C2S53_000723 [Perilla frutescens var. hirtella]|uniref:Uncharacterized protein n=1 Tax=Perilla frutescens var. hirtella TaxID=608512 RepID=A0AAD4J4T2_PERFH|nr:hypothetical protein C2S53_000723 [Perilla frutescens var. hirtella]
MRRMAAAIEEAGFWLPSEFLTEDDFLMDKENFNNELDTDFRFPSEFPYHFETHTDHLLQKFCATSTSPQSTLAYLGSAGGSNNGSPISAPSPPTTAMGDKCDAVGDLMYLAAGQVAKLKLNRGYAANTCPPPRYLAQFHKEAKIPAPSVYPNLQLENIGARTVGGMGQVAWAPHQIPSPRKAAFSGGGAAAKKVCAGTGVFLPRRYDNISDRNANSSGPRNNIGCSAASSPFQGRTGAQIHTKPCYVKSQPQPQRRVGRAFVLDHNSVFGPRHAVVLQQQQQRSFLTGGLSSMIGRELRREWTY